MIDDIHELAKYLPEKSIRRSPIIVTSGGFDPLHIGHVRCIQNAARLHPNGKLVVIVNGDGFLIRKKGKPFMPHMERMEIIDALKLVDYVVGWDDGSQTVTGALDILRPDFFAKGGDRSSADKVPEFELCEKIGCQVIFGVGGTDKVQSSSDLIKNSLECEHNWVMDGHNAGDPICSLCYKRG